MADFQEPTPPRPQITKAEQDRIIAAALELLHAESLGVRPNSADAMTLADHIKMAIYDSMRDAYAANGVPHLFFAMGEAATAKLSEIMTDRAL
jgi:hypothetical protein